MRRLPADLRSAFDAFRDVLRHVERASACITDVVPTTRLPGRPLADALLEFDEELGAARELMPAWRTEELESQWRSCDAGIAEALTRSEALRLSGQPPVGFEALIGAIGDLVAPLDAFALAAGGFRDLARRR